MVKQPARGVRPTLTQAVALYMHDQHVKIGAEIRTHGDAAAGLEGGITVRQMTYGFERSM